MAYEYVEIDGCQVEKHIAEAFKKMAEAFKKQFGLTLHVRSGMRTSERQQELYDLFKAGKGAQASPPHYSHHEADNKDGVGPIALDLYDSGKDPGVKFLGTARNRWLSNNCGRWGFSHTGKTFKRPEGWHFEGIGVKLADPVVHTGSNVANETKELAEKYGNPFGLPNVEGLQKISTRYAEEGKRSKIDNDWGEKSQHGFANFLRSAYGYKGDDVFGPVMTSAAAKWLREKYDYKGDDVLGPNMRAAFGRANEKNKNTQAKS